MINNYQLDALRHAGYVVSIGRRLNSSREYEINVYREHKRVFTCEGVSPDHCARRAYWALIDPVVDRYRIEDAGRRQRIESACAAIHRMTVRRAR